MKNDKTRALTGKNNSRLRNSNPMSQETNAAWADVDKLRSESKVSIPSLSSVEEAKEWVDDGSRL